MPSVAYYDGAAIFGAAVSVEHVPNSNASQVDAFFGVAGVISTDGGGRGRIFQVSGCWLATEPLGIRAAEELLMSYADGRPRPLVDVHGYPWPNVVFRGDYRNDGPLLFLADGYCQPYKAVFHGLT